MENKPEVGVAAIIRKDGKVLLGKRKGSHGQGTWGFPGGKLEFGEEFEECIHREIGEEVGVMVSNISFGAITNDVFIENRKHFITVFFVSDWKDGEPQILEPDKTGQWEWFEWDNLPTPLFLPIQNLLKQKFDPFSIR